MSEIDVDRESTLLAPRPAGIVSSALIRPALGKEVPGLVLCEMYVAQHLFSKYLASYSKTQIFFVSARPARASTLEIQ